MKMNRADRSLIAWILYASVLFSAFACSISHGQMTALQLSGIDGAYCSAQGNSGGTLDISDSDTVLFNPATGFGCSMCSTFVGIALAAFFGVLGLFLSSPRRLISPAPLSRRPVRYLWPSANPRASPFSA
ncbi:DUF2946 domain-containing protein [Pseudomonas segetis]|uniref:DUF2946 domain-containing protein n=1 Tax=Pseudomonas segetis TaxID=298908 RepID=A0A239GX04_9PSED|nr:DUF2946 domain-containing protein [Pseudomonas segetis]SNS73746.1 Protein of unknown function [Pseudomonas segetis]